jgi:hypothetical protein
MRYLTSRLEFDKLLCWYKRYERKSIRTSGASLCITNCRSYISRTVHNNVLTACLRPTERTENPAEGVVVEHYLSPTRCLCSKAHRSKRIPRLIVLGIVPQVVRFLIPQKRSKRSRNWSIAHTYTLHKRFNTISFAREQVHTSFVGISSRENRHQGTIIEQYLCFLV